MLDAEVRRLASVVVHRGQEVIGLEDRDPDLFDADIDSQREFRQRFIPSGLANEVLLDVYARLASFEKNTSDVTERLLIAYAKEVARIDQNPSRGPAC